MLNVLGSTLNVISLAGLAFAVGMFIDNAIVVLENIYRRHSLGESPMTAAVRGTQEVFGAVVASSLTNMAVFLPVIFVQEEAGQLFRDIALAITGALFLSILVAMTVIPTATSRLFRRHTKLDPPDDESKPRMRVVNPTNGNGADVDETFQSHTLPVAQPTSHWKHRVADLAVAPLNAFGAGFSNFVVGINRWALAKHWAATGNRPDDVGHFRRTVVAVLAEGRISAGRKSQPGDRLRVAAAGIQSRRIDEARQNGRRKAAALLGHRAGKSRGAGARFPRHWRLLLCSGRTHGVYGSQRVRPRPRQ